MTESFASAVAVTVPILALAAGAEARAIRERLRRPDSEWEQRFAAYQAERELDMEKPTADVLAYFRDVPAISGLYVAQRLLTVAGAVVWMVVFVLLTLVEVLGLIWLADGAAPGDSGLAAFSVVSVAVALVALIMAPALYLFVPLLLPLDVLPEGLKKAVAPKLATQRGREFLNMLFSELEGAVDRATEATERTADQAQAAPPGAAQPGGDA